MAAIIVWLGHCSPVRQARLWVVVPFLLIFTHKPVFFRVDTDDTGMRTHWVRAFFVSYGTYDM